MEMQTQLVGTYNKLDPPVYLRPYVEYFWFIRTDLDLGSPYCYNERVIPGSLPGITFARRRDLFGVPGPGSLWFFGPAKSWRFVKIESSMEYCGVRLRPEWIDGLFGVSPSELVDTHYPIREISPVFGASLEGHLQRTVSLDQVFATLTVFMAERIRHCEGKIKNAAQRQELFQSIRKCHGAPPPSWIAYHHGVSESFFDQFVAGHCGMTADHLFRILRLQNAIRSCYNTLSPDWNRVITDSGYADEARFYSEVIDLTGVAPFSLHKERRRSPWPCLSVDLANQIPDSILPNVMIPT